LFEEGTEVTEKEYQLTTLRAKAEKLAVMATELVAQADYLISIENSEE